MYAGVDGLAIMTASRWNLPSPVTKKKSLSLKIIPVKKLKQVPAVVGGMCLNDSRFLQSKW